MVMQVPWPVMNSLISLDLDHNNFGDNLAEPGRFNGLNVLQVTKNDNYNDDYDYDEDDGDVCFERQI